LPRYHRSCAQALLCTPQYQPVALYYTNPPHYHPHAAHNPPLSGSTLGCSRVLTGVPNGVLYRMSHRAAFELRLCRVPLCVGLDRSLSKLLKIPGRTLIGAHVSLCLRLTRRSRSYNPSALVRLHAPDADRSLLCGRPRPFPGGPLGTGPRSPAQARPFGPASGTRGGILPTGATIGPARSRGQHAADQGPEGAPSSSLPAPRPAAGRGGDAAALRALAWTAGRSMAGRPQCL
jgi:hypothetical protein